MHASRGVVLTAVALAAVFFVTQATAGSGDKSGSAIAYTAAAGETNVLLVTDVAGKIRIADTGNTVTPSGGCVAVPAGPPTDTIECADGGDLTVALGDYSDSLKIDASVSTHLTSITVDGGPGDDAIDNESTVPTTVTYADTTVWTPAADGVSAATRNSTTARSCPPSRVWLIAAARARWPRSRSRSTP